MRLSFSSRFVGIVLARGSPAVRVPGSRCSRTPVMSLASSCLLSPWPPWRGQGVDWGRHRTLPRALSIASTFLTGTVAVVGLFVIQARDLSTQAERLAEAIPARIQEFESSAVREFLIEAEVADRTAELLDGLPTQILAGTNDVYAAAQQGFELFLIVFLAIYVLQGGQNLLGGVSRLLPEEGRTRFVLAFSESSRRGRPFLGSHLGRRGPRRCPGRICCGSARATGGRGARRVGRCLVDRADGRRHRWLRANCPSRRGRGTGSLWFAIGAGFCGWSPTSACSDGPPTHGSTRSADRDRGTRSSDCSSVGWRESSSVCSSWRCSSLCWTNRRQQNQRRPASGGRVVRLDGRSSSRADERPPRSTRQSLGRYGRCRGRRPLVCSQRAAGRRTGADLGGAGADTGDWPPPSCRRVGEAHPAVATVVGMVCHRRRLVPDRSFRSARNSVDHSKHGRPHRRPPSAHDRSQPTTRDRRVASTRVAFSITSTRRSPVFPTGSPPTRHLSKLR